MKFRQRLEDGAKAVVRGARRLGSDLGPGPAAVYARILDGEHLWLAVPSGTGRPALWDPETRELVDVVDDLPADHAALDPGWSSVRWRLGPAVPERLDAELVVVVVPEDGGRPAGVRSGPTPPGSSLRVPPTSDFRWRFALVTDEEGLLRVRRTRAAAVARLLHIGSDGETVTITCTAPQDGPVQLLFISKDGVEHALPTERTDDGVTRVLAAADLPPEPGTYKVAVGTPEAHVSVARRHNDLRVEEWSMVLLPLVLDPLTAGVAGRLTYSPHGVLRVTRPNPLSEGTP